MFMQVLLPATGVQYYRASLGLTKHEFYTKSPKIELDIQSLF